MKHRPALLAALLAVLPLAGHADVSLPRIFGNHMVLQRETPLKVWGTADAGEKISLEFGPRSFSTTSDENGDWHIDLPPLKADGGKSHKLTIKGTNTIILEDILIGDVWLGSGQSNMEWNLTQSEGRDEFVKAANHPAVSYTHLTLPTIYSV